jgi:hypothetical protein
MRGSWLDNGEELNFAQKDGERRYIASPIHTAKITLSVLQKIEVKS